MRFTPLAERDLAYFGGREDLLSLYNEMRQADEAWRGARAFKLGYDTVRDMVNDYIAANYAYQKARWGRVRNRLSANSIMR